MWNHHLAFGVATKLGEISLLPFMTSQTAAAQREHTVLSEGASKRRNRRTERALLLSFNVGQVNFAWELPEMMHRGIQIPLR